MADDELVNMLGPHLLPDHHSGNPGISNCEKHLVSNTWVCSGCNIGQGGRQSFSFSQCCTTPWNPPDPGHYWPQILVAGLCLCAGT